MRRSSTCTRHRHAAGVADGEQHAAERRAAARQRAEPPSRQRRVLEHDGSGPPAALTLRHSPQLRSDVDDGAVIEPGLAAQRRVRRIGERDRAAFAGPDLPDARRPRGTAPTGRRARRRGADRSVPGMRTRAERSAPLEPERPVWPFVPHDQACAVGRQRQRRAPMGGVEARRRMRCTARSCPARAGVARARPTGGGPRARAGRGPTVHQATARESGARPAAPPRLPAARRS